MLAARVELVVVLGEAERAGTLRGELQALGLTEAERLRHREELEAADRLVDLTRASDETV